MPISQPGGQLTQIEVRGLRRDGEGGSFRKHLTTNCGCRTDGATIHLLEGLAVAVHVSLGAEQLHEKTDTCQRAIKKSGEACSKMFANFLPP